MKGRLKNNINISKENSLNLKISPKNQEGFYKANNISLDFTSSPIKNNKKVIKRNARTNSYNSFLFDKTENILTNKNTINSKLVSADTNIKINLKKNIFEFSNTKGAIGNNSKTKKNNTQKNNKVKQNIKSKIKSKNITTHKSTSNISEFNININTDTFNNILNINNPNEFSNCNTNPNIPRFLLAKKKNQKQNNHSHFQHFNLLNSHDYNFGLFSQNNKLDKEKDKFYFRNKNKTSKNLLFLTGQNINSKKYQKNNNKTSIYKNPKNMQIFNFNKKGIYFNLINSNSKSKKTYKNIATKTTKNSEDKPQSIININKIKKNITNNIKNILEISEDEQNNKILNEFELLYNCLKKRTNSCNKKKYNLLECNILNDNSLLGIIHENKQIKQKNEELSQQFENIKKEFEKMKKDNNAIKEELKEKTKYLKDIKLTMDIFSQELLKLQNIYKDNMDYNKNVNITDNTSHENQRIITEININKNMNNNINSKNTNNLEISIDNKDKNKINETDRNNTNINVQKKNKLEKIHQLSLNNINNLINKNNKKKTNSLEANNFQDSNKINYNETKDTTEKENEYLNDKWPSPLCIEKMKNAEKNNKEIIIKKENEEESIDLSNISLAENLNIDQEVYKNALNQTRKNNNNFKLDFKNKFKKNNETNNTIKKLPKNNNFVNQEIVNDNFNEEFLKNYDKFSDSWRKEVDKMIKKGKGKKWLHFADNIYLF